MVEFVLDSGIDTSGNALALVCFPLLSRSNGRAGDLRTSGRPCRNDGLRNRLFLRHRPFLHSPINVELLFRIERRVALRSIEIAALAHLTLDPQCRQRYSRRRRPADTCRPRTDAPSFRAPPHRDGWERHTIAHRHDHDSNTHKDPDQQASASPEPEAAIDVAPHANSPSRPWICRHINS